MPQLEGTVVTVDSGVDYVADATLDDDYRCFLIEAPYDQPYFVTGYEVLPDNAPTVHHVIVYVPYQADDIAAVRALDDADPEPGYTCFGGAGPTELVEAYPAVLWAPGAGATNFPAGTGIQLEGGAPLVMQVHYNNRAGNGRADRTRVNLEIAQSATRARIVLMIESGFMIQPGLERAVVVDDFDFGRWYPIPAGTPMTIYGAFPHMHTMGLSLRVEHINDATQARQCLIDVPRWDFNWQMGYFYDNPIVVDAADSMEITCTYDSRGRREVTVHGEGTDDEMCLSYFYVVWANGL